MKQRNGFVSNSSSSSFIIGLGVVPADRVSEFKQHLDKNKITEVHFKTVGELTEDPGACGWDLDVTVEYDELGNGVLTGVVVDAFDYSELRLYSADLKNLSSQDVIAYMYDSYGDDSDFYEYDEDGECTDYEPNYDISWDFFPTDMQTAGEVFDQAFMKHGHSTYGAGRNG